MIVSEKGLCKMLKREYKEMGYKIIQQNDMTIIGVDGMAVVLHSTEIPRQLLGLLVEHSGAIPTNCAIQVTAGQDNQTMLPGASLGISTDLEEPVRATSTPIIWGGHMRVYQCADHQVLAVRGTHLRALSGEAEEPVVDLGKEVAAWYGDNQEVFIPIITKKENAHLAALESHKWTL